MTKMDKTMDKKQMNKTASPGDLDSVLKLPVIVINVLNRAKIFTVDDLLQYSREDLLQLHGLGKKGVNLICEPLENMLQLSLPVIKLNSDDFG